MVATFLLLGMLVELATGFSPSVPSLTMVMHPRHSVMSVKAVGRRATLLGAGALAFSQQSAAWAKNPPPVDPRLNVAVAGPTATVQKKAEFVAKIREADPAFALYKSALAQSEKLVFSDLGWGDAEIKLLCAELQYATSLKKLFLNGNRISDEGVAAIEGALLSGAAPKLKILNLSQKPGLMSEKARQCLKKSRPGLQVSYANLKQSSDSSTLLAAGQGALKVERVVERAAGINGQLVDGSDATCFELNRIIAIDRVALKSIDDKEIEASVANQVERLVALKSTKSC